MVTASSMSLRRSAPVRRPEADERGQEDECGVPLIDGLSQREHLWPSEHGPFG
jgi:hypothetical protein